MRSKPRVRRKRMCRGCSTLHIAPLVLKRSRRSRLRSHWPTRIEVSKGSFPKACRSIRWLRASRRASALWLIPRKAVPLEVNLSNKVMADLGSDQVIADLTRKHATLANDYEQF